MFGSGCRPTDRILKATITLADHRLASIGVFFFSSMINPSASPTESIKNRGVWQSVFCLASCVSSMVRSQLNQHPLRVVKQGGRTAQKKAPAISRAGAMDFALLPVGECGSRQIVLEGTRVRLSPWSEVPSHFSYICNAPGCGDGGLSFVYPSPGVTAGQGRLAVTSAAAVHAGRGFGRETAAGTRAGGLVAGAAATGA